MNAEIARQFEQLPGNLAAHLVITILPLLIGLAISMPLALIAIRSTKLRYPVLTVVSVIQTIPSLALLALMVPILVLFNELILNPMGISISELGFYPTVIALTLYCMLPMLRNTVTGVLDVDRSLTEAARGVGMTSMQSLWKVELPLALPVIVAGIRTATVWTVGIATLATPVGQRCLGNYIFTGLHTRNWTAVLFGCVAAAVLAIILDLLIGCLQKAVEERRRDLATYAGSILAVLLVGGLLSPFIVSLFRPAALAGTGAREDVDARINRPLVIGSKGFTEQYILAEAIANQLQEAGFETRKKESLGSTIIFDGLVSGEVDVYVDYSGTIWANHMEHSGSVPAWQVLAEVNGWLAREHGVRCLGSLGFENAYALAMRREHAEELGIETISDLREHAADLKIGGDLEFFQRPEWRDVQSTYGLRFADRTSYDATFMYEALSQGEVDVVSAFTTDGRIDTFDLVLLEDDRNAIPPYHALVLVSPEIANSERVAEALMPLIESISRETMSEANHQVDRDEDKKSIEEAADWLWGQTESE